MTAEPVIRITPQAVYARLMAARRGDPVEDTLARIIASWSLGIGAMPSWLGLGEVGFRAMLKRYFPRLGRGALPDTGVAVDMVRLDEMADLRKLLLENRTNGTDTQALMAELVVVGCMGNDHLWQDLGLWCRADLSKLMKDHFAPLALRNQRDMKWKKFLYKQLCETEGIYTCRAPSCEVCADFAACFGPED